MRRFTLWTILLLTLGVALASLGYWAYWKAYARYQPATVAENAAEVEALLNRAVWLSESGGERPVWLVGPRDAAFDRYYAEELPKLRAAGLETRVIVFAPRDADGAQRSTAAERATVAAIWLTRDAGLWGRWMATPAGNWTAQGVPAADGDLARSAVVDASRDFADRLAGLIGRDAGRGAWPMVIWRDDRGFLKACACASPRAWPFVRDDVGAPDSIAAAEPIIAGAEPEVPLDAATGSRLPYPEIAPLAEVQPQPIPAPAPSAAAPNGSGSVQRPAARQPPPASRPPTPRAQQGGPRPAPKPQQQDDATFF